MYPRWNREFVTNLHNLRNIYLEPSNNLLCALKAMGSVDRIRIPLSSTTWIVDPSVTSSYRTCMQYGANNIWRKLTMHKLFEFNSVLLCWDNQLTNYAQKQSLFSLNTLIGKEIYYSFRKKIFMSSILVLSHIDGTIYVNMLTLLIDVVLLIK